MDAARHCRNAAMVPASRRDGLPCRAATRRVEMGVAGSTRLFVGHYGLDVVSQLQHPRLAVLDYGAASTVPWSPTAGMAKPS